MPSKTCDFPPVGSRQDQARRLQQRAAAKAQAWRDRQRPTGLAPQLCPASGPSIAPPPQIVPLYSAMSATKELGSSSLRNAIATEAEKIKKIVASFDTPGSSDLIDRAICFSLENLSEEDVYHRVRVGLTLAANLQKTNVIVAGLLLGIGYEAIKKEFGTGIAELVMGTAKLKPFAYNRAMEKSSTSSEQKFLVLLARIKEVPDMACHIIQAIAVLEELKISMASDQLSIMQGSHKLSTEKIALAQEAIALQTEVLARLGFNRLAAELVNAAGYHLDPQAYMKAKGNIETIIGMKLEKSKDELTKLNQRLAATAPEIYVIHCRTLCRQKEIIRILEKMLRQGGWDNILDFWGIRWIFNASEEDTPQYVQALRTHIIRKLAEEGWEKEEVERDFIQGPKPNGFRSYQMHFNKKLRNGQFIRLAVHLRNEAMDIHAEHGTASHWANYKQALAGYDPIEFDRQLKRLGNTHEETIAMRWQYLQKLARQYSFAYVINGDHKPKAAQISLDWPKVKMVKIYLGQREELIPSIFDVALAAGSPPVINPGYTLNTKGAIENSPETLIKNGGLVYLNLTSKRRITEKDFKAAQSPWSAAIILLELERLKNATCVYQPAVPGQEKLDATRQELERLIDLKTNVINPHDFVFPDARQKPKIAIFKDLDLAAQRAGFGSAETIALCLAMATDPAKIRSLFLEKLDQAIQKTLVYCAFFQGKHEDENSIYVLPEEDRPGVLWFIVASLVQNGLGVKALFSHNQGNKRGFHIITQKKDGLIECCEGFAQLQARIKDNFPEPAAGTQWRDGNKYQFTIKFSAEYNIVLPEIFISFGHNLMIVQEIHAARREEGHDASISFTCKIKKRNRLSFESSQIERLIKEIKARAAGVQINYNLIKE